MDKITLTFRRGGGWSLVANKWYAVRVVGAGHVFQVMIGDVGWTAPEHEYAELPPFEIATPDPEPLRIPGYEEPQFRTMGSDDDEVHAVVAGRRSCTSLCVHGSTRREAIERFNLLAKVMGGK